MAIEKTLKKETRMNINDKNARLSALKAKMQADSKRSFDGKKDREDFWQTPTGESTVRLLHHPNDESPVIPYYNHAFKEKEWFIEDCPLSIDLPCPVCEAGRKGHERKVYFVANVFVPDTWAIQWWKFGQQIFDVIEAVEDRKQALIDDLLRQRAEAIKVFDDKLAKLGHKARDGKPRRSHHKPAQPPAEAPAKPAAKPKA